MEKNRILDMLKEKVLVLDGAMGTMLQRSGFEKGCPDELNITDPELVKSIHKAYADSGSDLIITNTFGSNRLKLEKYGLQDKLREINEAAVNNVREACPKCLIVGGVGPLGEFIEPLGKISFDDAYSLYKEQISCLKDADLIIIETISDIMILKAAVIAAKDVFAGPVITSMTLQDGRSTTGTDTKTYVAIAESLGTDIIGVNCSDGPEGMHETLKVIAANTGKPICLEPNAGLPKIAGEKAVWDYPIEKFAGYAKKFADLGANIIGGCCGTDPGFIRAVSERVKNIKPKKRPANRETVLCSRTKTMTVKPTLIVGERINPTNRPGFADEIKKGRTDYVRGQALQQVNEGASLLDINTGVAGADESDYLPKAVSAVQSIVDVPLVIDTSDPKALEKALKVCSGKPLVNSVNGSEKSLREVLPLAKKYGAAVIALCLDDSGIPKTREKRVGTAKKIIKEALKAGIREQDLIVDCLVLTIATNPENKDMILGALKEIKKIGYKAILGVSNISHGLPDRSRINSKFYTQAHKAGLDLAILNPLDNILMKESDIRVEVKKVRKEDYKGLPIDKQLYNAVLYGDKDNIIRMIEGALGTLKAIEINDILIKALEEVGKKFNNKEYFLPNVLLSAETMKTAFIRLKRELAKEGGKEKGTVLFATVENDIHDIGKNIVIALLESHNYKVIDLGANVKTSRIISEAKKHKPDILALSALMTTTVVEMKNIINELRKQGINIPVIIGGAVVTDDYAHQIKAAYGKDALSAVKSLNELLKKRHGNG
ncbi:homocysteine S-methyltransferase family protein [Candidatus Woesearchaeota archaeon]|nr:homocysteine S-methyltransferase family protein [Candidatus Woesearchaeota archaeon]